MINNLANLPPEILSSIKFYDGEKQQIVDIQGNAVGGQNIQQNDKSASEESSVKSPASTMPLLANTQNSTMPTSTNTSTFEQSSENIFQTLLPTFLDLKKYTAHRYKTEFTSLNKKICKIQITGLEKIEIKSAFPVEIDDVALYINSNNIEQPFVLSVDDEVKNVITKIDVEIRLSIEDVAKLIEMNVDSDSVKNFSLMQILEFREVSKLKNKVVRGTLREGIEMLKFLSLYL